MKNNMERILKCAEESICTITSDMEIDLLIKLLTKKKEEIIKKYPEAVDNRIEVLVEYDTEYRECELSIGYIRKETDAEYRCRMKSIENENKAKNAALRRMIDSNKEEAISYLKSIGVI